MKETRVVLATLGTALCIFALPFTVSAEDEVNELVASPTVDVDGVLYEVRGVKLDPRAQMENLIGIVESIEERAEAIDKALDKIDKRLDSLEKQLDDKHADKKEIERLIAVNEFMFSILLSEKETVADELNIKKSIAAGSCPTGTTLLSASNQNVSCISSSSAAPEGGIALLSTTPSGLSNFYVSYFATIPAGGKTNLAMACPSTYIAGAGGHYLTAEALQLEMSSPDASNSRNWNARIANWDTITRYALGIVNCIQVSP